MTATGTTTTVVVPGTQLMAALVGPRDQHLRQIEDAFPGTDISVRGNEVSIRGDQSDEVGRLFEELVDLLQMGHHHRLARAAQGDQDGVRRRATE